MFKYGLTYTDLMSGEELLLTMLEAEEEYMLTMLEEDTNGFKGKSKSRAD